MYVKGRCISSALHGLYYTQKIHVVYLQVRLGRAAHIRVHICTCLQCRSIWTFVYVYIPDSNLLSWTDRKALESTLNIQVNHSEINKGHDKVTGANTYTNKRPMGLNGHLSIRDFTLTSCQKGSYLYINSPIIE